LEAFPRDVPLANDPSLSDSRIHAAQVELAAGADDDFIASTPK
jgi:hypothetical protein